MKPDIASMFIENTSFQADLNENNGRLKTTPGTLIF
jgi:hypothetical protein